MFPLISVRSKGNSRIQSKTVNAPHSSPPGGLAALGSNPSCLSNQNSFTPNRHIATRSGSP